MSNQATLTGNSAAGAVGRLVRLCLILTVVSGAVIGLGRLVSPPGLLLFSAKVTFLVAAGGGAFLHAARRTMGEARTLKWVMNLALLVTTLAVMTVLAEFGLRLLFSGITTTSDNSSYWARGWKATHVRLNHLGYREREFPSQKPPGVYRIAIVGDSFTYGQGIDEGDRFSNRVQAALDRGRQRFEVLNFGKTGAQTVDEVRVLEDPVVGTRPDFVLLVWYINDIEGYDITGKFDPVPLMPSSTLRSILHHHSVFYYILEQEWFSAQMNLGWINTMDVWMQNRFGDPNSPWTRQGMDQLRAFLRVCRLNKIPMGIVLFPDLDGILKQEYPFAFLHEYVLAFCAQENLACLDLRESMARAAFSAPLMVNRFDGHPNAEANRIAAEEILKRFEPIWNPAAVRSGIHTSG